METDRLVIRPPQEPDRERYVALLTDPTTRMFLGGSISFTSQTALELSPLGLTWGAWILHHRVDDHLCGSFTFTHDRGELELLYALLPEYTRQGYAAEACAAMLRWAQESLADDHVIAVTQRRNRRSLDLLKRLGFTVRHGLEEFGAQQLLLERSLREPIEVPGPAS